MCLGPEIALVAQVVGATAAAGGATYGVVAGQQQAAASQRAEKLRKQQLGIESRRKQIEAVRNMQIKRAMSISNISGATGSLENSAYGGATSALSANLGSQLGEISQAESIGRGIFEANADYSQASANMQTAQSISSFGKDLFASGPEIGRIGSTLFGSSGGWKTTYE